MTASSPTFPRLGGSLCLDFVNTVENWHDRVSRWDQLATYDDLVIWSVQLASLSDGERATLQASATCRPAAAQAVLRRARELRQAIRDIALALAHGHPVDPDALIRLNTFVHEVLAQSRLVTAEHGMQLRRTDDPAALDRLLWPIVGSAIDLFTSSDQHRVRECAGETCGLVFVDASRNGQRRWCTMATCGNVAKARRFRSRHRDGQHGPERQPDASRDAAATRPIRDR